MMAALFDSGRIVELILVIMLLEALVVCGFALGRNRSGVVTGRLPGLLLNLAAGAALLLALRAVLTGSGWMLAGVWLTAALAAHVGDLVFRLRSTRDGR